MSRHEKDFALFRKFVEGGYDRKRFTKDLYRALYLSSFGFIAHYDLGGFYAARFGGWAERVETLTQVLERTALGPFEEAAQGLVRREGLLDEARRASASELEAVERAELARLKAKWET